MWNVDDFGFSYFEVVDLLKNPIGFVGGQCVGWFVENDDFGML